VAEVGIVAIGRNEGDRLVRCLRSVSILGTPVVYVDSGSSDRSVEVAQAFGAIVIELDSSVPFGPARARNEGARRLLELDPAVQFIQFIDGDCELREGWIAAAVRQLRENPRAAAVAGRLRERSPQASIYNRICDIEWDGPIGEVTACGGIAMMRQQAFQEVGGFDASVLAAEDDEICLRLRRRGWTIVRISAEMALHDAGMSRLRQWWRRAKRCGYAYAQGAKMHGRSPDRHFVREVQRSWLWGFFLPALALAAAWPTRGASLLLLACYPLQFARIYRSMRLRGVGAVSGAAYASSCIVSKFAEVAGAWKFKMKERRGTPMQLIEHR
jgi:GT2 family glycosyltransferase